MNIVVTERDKKLLRLVACLAIIVIFGMYLIRPAMKNHETLQNEYDAAEQKQQEYQTQIATLATIDDIIAQNEAALNTASEKYYKGDLETRQMDDIITGIALENGLFPQSLTLTEAAPGA
ncbi:type II secretion system protein GspM, partial [Butyricicoccus sp.]